MKYNKTVKVLSLCQYESIQFLLHENLMTNIALGFTLCYICHSTLTSSSTVYFIQTGDSALSIIYRIFHAHSNLLAMDGWYGQELIRNIKLTSMTIQITFYNFGRCHSFAYVIDEASVEFKFNQECIYPMLLHGPVEQCSLNGDITQQ